uniref:unconventional myosin-X isoform X2 n=1 Tax=Ciona intestinalis TaxID=7719 RepID=UPI0002B8DDD0|nr:unconventional myosin-X isoform X2 [Ciona intestinalis]|eukprot:XP_018666876.1 unconventional myosin-X isoform X2 [Ciona intestinalis]
MAESDVTTVGSRVWLVKGSPDDLTPATVTQCDGVEVVYQTDYGEEQRMWMNEIDPNQVKPMNGVLLQGVEDMAKMTELNQASILCNLNTRYQQNEIYTYIGSILISVNPYKRLHDLYDEKTLARYTNKDLGEESPHVFAIANECYTCLWKREESQCVLISGESGAGKTEATKFILKFISNISRQRSGKVEEENGKSIEKSILESGPVLEALGNAKTVYNNNSSRFGKFVQLLISESGQIKGGRITDYLLEKHRVVRQNPGERNYHIFYQLIQGATPEQRDRLFLMEPGEYHYLNQSGCVSDPTLNDAEDWAALEQALNVIGFKDGQKQDMMSVLSGILHLGNVSFMNAGGAQVVDTDVIDRTSQLLGIDSERLEAVMKERTMKLRGENITSPQSIDQACDSRDSIAMAVYSQLFRWIISKINHRIKGPDDFYFIGILDIFGFENFKINRFEQFCINFANEKLQEFFNRHIFSLEQIEYNKEGIDWCDVEWADNSECLDLVEKNLGLMSLINEESRFPKGTDKSLLNKLHNQHAKNQFYVKPRVIGLEFGIKHYAGEVMYNVTGFLEKNRDTFRDDLLGLLKDSSCDLIYDLFEKVRGNSESSGKGRSKQAPTASGQFKKSLHALMERLSSANPFFVRCVKPNILKVPDNFNAGIVLNQLRYSGMLETVRVRKAGFPVRRLYKDFWDRYSVVCPNAGDLPETQDRAKSVLNEVEVEGTLWRLGETKVFMKEILEQMLEKVRGEKVFGAAVIIQSVIRAYGARKHFLKLKACSVHAQRFIRGFIARRKFRKAYSAIIRIQKMERGRQARKIFAVLVHEKREKERIKKEATIVIQKYTRGFAARKMFKVLLEKHRQLKALKEQMERERKEREQQARLERERLEREEKERIQREKEEKAAREAALSQPQALPSPMDETPAFPPPFEDISTPLPTDLSVIPTRTSVDARLSAMANLDAVIEQADIDSAYSTVNKKTFSEEGLDDDYLEEQEKLEMERILQLELEIAQMHRRSEARSSIISTERDSRIIENVGDNLTEIREDVFPNKDKADETRGMDILQDLGFEEFEHQMENMNTDVIHDAPPEDMNTESWNDNEDSGNVDPAPTSTSDIEDESYYTDSSFDDDDISDTDTVASGPDNNERWNPNVYFHSYLDMKGGLMSQWKKRWCVISNSTFMFFRSKQDSLKCGWLYKKSEAGRGTLRGTLPRKNWQKKWVALRNHEMKIYDNDDENAKCKATIDLSTITDVTDVTEKENGIDVIMSSKVHHFSAESTEEANEWYSILMKILSSSEQEIANMETEFANPKNAIGTVDGQTITAVAATSVSGKSNTFSITTSQRVYVLACDTVEEMHHWITLLNESMNTSNSADSQGQSSAIQQGWMMKTNFQRQRVTHQRRWFVLKPNVIEYYKSSGRGAQKMGSMGLNSLCLVTSPDEAAYKQTGLWEIKVYGKKHTLILSTEVEEDANLWSSEIQAMIDAQPIIVTKTKLLIDKMKHIGDDEKEITLLYKRNPILRQSQQSLRSPLLSLPYEQVSGTQDSHHTLRDEAIKYFDRLLSMENDNYTNIEEEAGVIQDLLRTCHGSKSFQDEVYLQLIKQTAIYTTQLTTDEQMCEQQHVTTCPHYWHLIACMCCAYHPSRPVMQYLKFHLKRVKERYPETPGGVYAAFAEKSINKQTSRRREMVPSIPEICAALERRDLVTVIKCYGGATCDIYIDSFTTAGQVVQKLRRGMQLEGNRNTFALFEKKGTDERALEPATFLCDSVAKFESLNHERDMASGELEWELYFKLYCVFDPMEVKEDSIAYHFVFEDVHEQVINGLYPASEDILRELAALRLQFVVGNYTQLDWDSKLDQFYPVTKVKEAYEITANGDEYKEKRSGSFNTNLLDSNTTTKKRASSSIFNTFRKRGMKKVKEDEEGNEMKRTLFQEELQDVRSNVAERWRKLRGMEPEDAVVEYVNLARTWPGYGSYLFKVENNEAQFGESRLSLAVASKGVTVYKRGHPASLDHFSFEKILSFGATSATVFRLQTESRGDLSFYADQVTEIVKLMRAYVQALYKRHHR